MLRAGFFPADDFKEIKVDSASRQNLEMPSCSGVEIVLRGGDINRRFLDSPREMKKK